MHRESVFLLFFFFSLPPPCNNIHRIHRIKEVYEEEEYFSEKFKKHLTASKLSPWKSNIVFRELFHYSRSTRIFKMGNKKKEEERRERERTRDERGTNEDGKIRRFTVRKHENHRETSTRRCESTLQGARITLAKNVLPRATRHVPFCVYSFCIAHDGLNVPRKFHGVFVTSFSFVPGNSVAQIGASSDTLVSGCRRR